MKPALVLLTGAADISEEAYNNRVVADLWSMHESWMNDEPEHPMVSRVLVRAMSGELLKLVHEGKYYLAKVDDIGDTTGKSSGRQSEDEIIITIMGGLPTAELHGLRFTKMP